MKKFSLLILFVAFVSSCSQPEEVAVSDKQSKDELFVSLENFNDSILSTKTQTRGFLSFLSIATADIAGAYELGRIGAYAGSFFPGYGTVIGGTVGAVAGGVGSSYLAYCGCKMVKYPSDVYTNVKYVYTQMASKIDATKYVDTNIKANFPGEYKEAVKVGIQHNLMLDAVKNDSFKATRGSDNITPLTKQEEYILNSPEFVSQYNSIMPRFYSSDVNKYITDDSKGAMVIKLFIEVYNKYPQDIDDVNLIINNYIERIEKNPSLTNEEKQLVYNGLAVAAYSFQYWKNRL